MINAFLNRCRLILFGVEAELVPSQHGGARCPPLTPRARLTRWAQRQAKNAAGGSALAAQRGTRGLVLVVMCVGYFLVLLDVTIVNVALPSIGTGLGSSVVGLQWVVDGYALALASLLLASGTIGDRRGYKQIVLVGLAVFGIASLGCALAPHVAVLIGTRVLQGIGAALLLPGTLAIISRTYPDSAEQARAIGIWAGVGSIALPAWAITRRIPGSNTELALGIRDQCPHRGRRRRHRSPPNPT
jgi:Major Facilitator Superfamily